MKKIFEIARKYAIYRQPARRVSFNIYGKLLKLLDVSKQHGMAQHWDLAQGADLQENLDKLIQEIFLDLGEMQTSDWPYHLRGSIEYQISYLQGLSRIVGREQAELLDLQEQDLPTEEQKQKVVRLVNLVNAKASKVLADIYPSSEMPTLVWSG